MRGDRIHSAGTKCIACGADLSYEPQMCCSGYMCGCMGLPIEPPVCSTDCWDVVMSRNPRAKQGAPENGSR